MPHLLIVVVANVFVSTALFVTLYHGDGKGKVVVVMLLTALMAYGTVEGGSLSFSRFLEADGFGKLKFDFLKVNPRG